MNTHTIESCMIAAQLDLPIDHRRNDRLSDAGAQMDFQVPAEIAGSLERLADHENCALYPAYLAAYAVLLSRYGNAREVLVAISIAVSGLIRIDCAPETSFTTLMAAVSRIQPVPDAAPSNVFFSWEQSGAGVPAECDLALGIRQDSDARICSLRYRADLFEASTIERMTRHFMRLLQSIAAHPHALIGELDMLPDEERALILGQYSGESAEYPRCTIQELVAEQAALHPEAEALVFGSERLTYRELDQRSNQIAHFLRQQGMNDGDRGGIFMDRSVAMIITMLGILKAGGVYVPIDPEYPPERLQFLAQDTEVRWVFTEQNVGAALPTKAPLIYLNGEGSPVAGFPRDPVPNRSTPESVAVMIYTSGSTGRPKAVCIPHRAVIRTVRNSNQVQVTPQDRIAQIASPSFDAAIFEIWLALANGATLVGMRHEVLLGPAQLIRLLQTERISILILNTAYVHQIGRDSPEVLKGVRKVMFGGETAEATPLRNILPHVAPGTLVNSYGPAEGCVATTYHEIFSLSVDMTSVPIGRPITNARMYLLDARMQPVPLGLVGEIYIGGEGVAKGYWNRPELTAQKFLPDPFTEKPGALLYRTGDLARLRGNGDFEFVGRIDDQIKIRGHRIELAEVREAITSHSAVKQAFLMVREDAPGDKRLVAYVTLRRPLVSAADALRRYAAEKLPAHMLPAAFVILDSIPLNTNGKVDRTALPAPSQRPDMANGYSAPQTDLEQMLTRIWQELLRIDRVGLDDNFFDLGGHSLLAARLIARIEKETGENIPVATLFQAPTVAQLARKLRDHTYASAWAPLVELRSPQGPPLYPPFFCIHSLGANLVSFHKLAGLLRPDRAIYGLQPPGLDGNQAPLDTMDAIASAYLEEIRKKQPRGPYYLGGICIGGVVAYEIARRLRAAGEEVRFLALIDSFFPGQLRHLHAQSQLTEYLDCHLGEFLMFSGTARLKYLARWIGNGFVRLGWALGIRSHASVARTARRVSEENIQAIQSYSPQPYMGKITQFMCSDGPQRSYEDRRLAWSSLSPNGLEIHVVPGDHLNMVEEPNVRVLAHELQNCLDRADERPRRAERRTVPAALPVAS
jgi:amino acid adenylation domain-containing protein